MLLPELIQIDTGEPYPFTCTVYREHSFSGGHCAQSHMLVCPCCCKIWGWFKVHDDELLYPRAQSCEACNVEDDWMPVPGSILVEEGWGVIDEELLKALPDELVKREFRLHLEAYS